MNLVRMFGMALAGAAMLAGTAFTFEAPRRVIACETPTIAHLSVSAVRTVARQVFVRAKPAPHSTRVACGGHTSDA